MVTVQISPAAVTEPTARPERAKGGGHSRRRSARTMIRSAGVILGAAWRVVLLGGDVQH